MLFTLLPSSTVVSSVSKGSAEFDSVIVIELFLKKSRATST